MEKSMEKNMIIGIDFSKLTLDVTCLYGVNLKSTDYQQFENTEKGCLELIRWLKTIHKKSSDWLVCGEFTGIYTMTSAMVFNEHNIDFWLENPSQIKYSSGVNREKNDKVDSFQIAMYAKRFIDRVKLFNPKSDTLMKIRELTRFKDRLTKIRTQLLVPSKELKRVRNKWSETILIDNLTNEMILHFDEDIKILEKKITTLLKTDPELKKLYDLINSVVGVGMQTAIYLLIHTWGFTAFKTSRQLACYCGIVPFSKQSGTSIKGKGRVSNIANKKLKSLLHMCALNAVRYDPVLKEYYERKTGEGKHKMNVLNNVRNKLIQRIWAVVQHGEMYDKNYIHSMTIAA